MQPSDTIEATLPQSSTRSGATALKSRFKSWVQPGHLVESVMPADGTRGSIAPSPIAFGTRITLQGSVCQTSSIGGNANCLDGRCWLFETITMRSSSF